MKRIITKLLCLLLAAVMLVTFAACNEAGPQGEKGEQGPQGEPGPAGKDGRDGLDGRDGATPTVLIGENGNW